ncbi:MAG: hypothetical protein ACI8SE_000608 [Bacteroidia bacterium]|jgi:hypothetical protein
MYDTSRMSSKLLLVVFFTMLFNLVFAQKVDWIKPISGSLDQYGHHVIVNQQNEIIVIGSAQDTTDFDPTGTIKPLIINHNYDAFVAKYRDDGSLVWARNFGADSIDYGNDITQDTNGNIYITGLFRHTLIIKTLTGTDTLISKGVRDCFVIKLNTDGDVIWTKSIGSTGYESGQGIVADSFNNLYLTGYYQDSLELNPGMYLLPTGDFVMFVMKLDATTGKIYWGKSMNRSYDGRSRDGTGNIELGSDGNIYINGSLTQRHLLKLDTSGKLLWKFSEGRTNFSFRSRGICADSRGHVYTVGEFTETCIFSGNPKTVLQCAKYNECTYITKSDTNGTVLWARKIEGTRVFSSVIETDKMGRVHVGGSFFDEADFNPGDSVELRTTSFTSDSYMLSLDNDGNFLSVHTMGDRFFDGGCGLAVNKLGNVIETGYFSGGIVADSSSTKFKLASKGGTDGYVLKYNCLQRQDTLVYQICEGDSVVSPSQLKTWYKGGIYLDTISSIASYCPDIYVVKIDVVKINTVVKETSDSLTSLDTGGTYQWYNCYYTPPLLLPGDTNQSVFNNDSGAKTKQFMVEISRNGCVSRSNCYDLWPLSVEGQSGQSLRIYPNPTNDFVTLQLAEPTIGKLQLFDVQGRLILDRKLSNQDSFELVMPENSGMYLVCVTSGDRSIYKRVIKQ